MSRVIVCLAVVASLVASRAEASPATDVVKGANDRIRTLLAIEVAPGSAEEAKVAGQVTDRVRDFLDVDQLGKLALVDHWERLAAAQQTEFLRLLRSLVEQNYVRGLRANLDYKVAYTGEKRDGEQVVVTTEIRAKKRGRPVTISVDYKLARDGKAWRAFDVVTDGVGLVENYRAQFNRIIDKEGFDGLLRRMRKKQTDGAAAAG
jgi:phospholipid transport system substrate-binding protein